MGIKRPLMILGSTVGAVAAVLSYHPAAGGTSMVASAPEVPVDTPAENPSATPTPEASASAAPTQDPTPQATASATASATAEPAKKKSTTKKSTSAGSSANATTDSAPSAPAPTAEPAPTNKVAKDQVVAGATTQTRWGPVQVQITVRDGKIVDAKALQYPNGDRRSLWISEQAIPWLIEETLAVQSADIQVIGGATYTSAGWNQSLASALQKAGL